MSDCSRISNCHHQPLHQMLRLMLLWWLFGVTILQVWGQLMLVQWSIPLAALWADFRVSIILMHRCFPTVKQCEQAKDTVIKIVFSLNLGQEPSSCFSLLPHMWGNGGGLPEVWYLHIKICMLFQRRNAVVGVHCNLFFFKILFSWCFDSKSTRETTYQHILPHITHTNKRKAHVSKTG